MTTANAIRVVIAGVLGCAVAFTAFVLGAAPSPAATSVRSGWWTSAPLLVAPDVSAGQLLVQGGAAIDAPVAYAGITFALAAGERPQTLTLAVGTGSASTPGTALTLCPLLAAATPARGAPASSGPAFDCAIRVDATPSPDGTAYEFDLAAVMGPGSLGVAVLAAGPSDRVVLDEPNTSALRSAMPAADVGSGPAAPPTTTGPVVSSGTDGGAVGAPSSSSGGGGSAAASAPTRSPAATPAAGAPQTGGTTTVAPVAAGVDGSSRFSPESVSSGDRSFAPFGFVGMAVGAAALWSVAGQRTPAAASPPGDDA